MADLLRGKPVWYELLTTDLAAAEAFYTAIVDWTVAPFQGGTGTHPYRVLNNAAGRGVGGMMPLPEGMNAPPHWVMYLGAPDIDEAIATVERLGGSGLSPLLDIPDVGRLRTMRDPQGAMFSLLEPSSSERTPDTPPGLGEVSWHELYTTDAEAAMRFYTEAFGWKETDVFDMGPMGKYRMFGRSFPLGGMMTKTPDMANLPTHWGLYFRVPDVDAGAERVKAKGGQVLQGPMDVPGGDRVVQCMDPQGAAFSLHRPA